MFEGIVSGGSSKQSNIYESSSILKKNKKKTMHVLLSYDILYNFIITSLQF